MRLGVLLDNLGASQLAFNVLRKASVALADGRLSDFAAFYERPCVPCLPAAHATMHLAEAWGYAQPLVATDLNTAAKLVGFPSCPAKLFYVWDLEWTRRGARPYGHWAAVYRHPALTLLARSEEHRRLVEKCWNRPVAAICDDFDVDAILAVLRSKVTP